MIRKILIIADSMIRPRRYRGLIYGMTAFCASVVMSLTVVLAAQGALAQESVSDREKSAADTVAEFIATAREHNGLPKLRRIRDGHLRVDACRRAAGGDESLGHSSGIGPPEKVGTLSALWYSTPDPNQPPPELLEWAMGPEQKYEQPHRFAVGVCLVVMHGVTEHDQGQRYYIDVGTYMGAIKSILNIPMWD